MVVLDQRWQCNFMELAKLVATWSKDPSTKVGAVIVDHHKRVRSIGFNGFPRGVEDSATRLQDRARKYAMIVHAEVNAILNAIGRVDGCAIFVWPLHPCSQCAAALIQAGIVEIYTTDFNVKRWQENFDIAYQMLSEAYITVHRVNYA